MIQKQKVSVIMAVYNSEKFLNKSISSILNQVYKNLEILLVNDGSTDNSKKIIKDFSEQDKRIIMLDKPNGGQGSARNYGLTRATGEFVIFVDSDDYYHENMISETMSKMLLFNTDLVVFQFQFVSEKGENLDYAPSPYFQNQKVHSSEALRALFLDQLGPMGRNMLIRKSLLDNTEIRFPEDRTREDGGTIYKLIGNSEQLFFLNEQFYYYVQHDSSTVHKFNKRNFFDVIKNNLELFEYVEERYSNLYDEAVDFSLNNLFNDYRNILFNKAELTDEELFTYDEAFDKVLNQLDLDKCNKKIKHKIFFRKYNLLSFVYKVKSVLRKIA